MAINTDMELSKVLRQIADAIDEARSPDRNVELNRNMLLERSKLGLKKYGVTTERNDLNLEDWLQHALEETLDLANYLQAAIQKIKSEKK